MARLTVPVDDERDHIQGPRDARVTLLEYGDFECPACGAAHPVVKELRERLGDRVRFVFRNFPLGSVHPRAERAALAAEAANTQGRFWEMHDLLFENQDALDEDDLLRYAAALGLDMEAFGEAMDGEPVLSRVREDFLSGVRSGVNGTPTFFINDLRHEGSYQLPALLRALTEASAAA
jgi:protein-disulfide isomerase